MRDRCVHVRDFTSPRQETLSVVALHKAAQGNDGGACKALTVLYLKMEVRFSATIDAQARGQCGAGVTAGIGAVIDGAVGAVTGGAGKVAGLSVGVGPFWVSYL